MFKVKRLVGQMLQANPYLVNAMNRARIYNSYMCFMEIGLIIFQISIAARTNQSSLVFHFIVQSILAIFAML